MTAAEGTNNCQKLFQWWKGNLTHLILIHWPCLGYQKELLGKKVVLQDALEEGDQEVTLLQLKFQFKSTYKIYM